MDNESKIQHINKLKLKLYETQLKIKGYEKEIRIYLPGDFRWNRCLNELIMLKSLEYELTDEIQAKGTNKDVR